MGRMTADYDHLQQAAKDHLWMHFARHSVYKTHDVPIIVKGEGAYIWDAQGRRYLDALGGLFTSQLGHGRADLAEVPEVFRAVMHAAASVTHPPALAALARRAGKAYVRQRRLYR